MVNEEEDDIDDLINGRAWLAGIGRGFLDVGTVDSLIECDVF